MNLAHYDIAHYLGNKALDNLYLAYKIYKLPISQALAENGINGFNIDFKVKSDIESEKLLKTVCNINLDSVDPINAFHFANHLEALKKREAEHCIDSAIYFQAMMEADINDVLGSKANGTFKDKWLKFLKSNNASKTEVKYFESYHDNIYKKIRIPTVHAQNRKGLTNIESLRFSFVHENIKNGWFSFVFLLNKVHDLNMDYNENWQMMSEQAHGIPAVIEEKDYPDYSLIASSLYQYHLDYLNSISK